MYVGLALFSQLAASCAAQDVSQRSDWVRTLSEIAAVESSGNSLAIHDNTSRLSFSPTSRDSALKIATGLVQGGESVDLGLMQINSKNLPSLGMSLSDAFEPCRSIAAGSHILREGYNRALEMAFSIYNTGDPTRGLANGYVAKVEAAGVRPPDPQNGVSSGTSSPPAALDQPPQQSSCAPAWDVWAAATCSDSTLSPAGSPLSGVTSVSVNMTSRNIKHAE